MIRRDRIDPTYSNLGAMIRRRRRELRLTQQEAADLGGVGVVFVIEVEAGKNSVRLDRLITLMIALGLRFRAEEGTGGLITDASS